MAGSMRFLTKLKLGLLTKSITRRIAINQSRTLFSQRSLGMTSYLSARQAFKNKFVNLEDSFRNKMKSYVDQETSGMIFTEDLKAMLHLAENTPEDKELLVKMLRKYNGQSSEMRFSTFMFGPIVMRSFYRLNEADLAFKLFNDKDFETFFNQLSSYQILLDLLYTNKKYKEMMHVYDIIKGRITEDNLHPRNSVILITAGCYKENTPESWKYGIALWRDLDRRGYPIIRRVMTQLSALAINQGHAHIAIEILMTAKKPRYIAIRCLKIMAFCNIDRLDDVIPFFRASLEQDEPSLKKETYFKDAIDAVEAAIEKAKLGPDAEIVKLLKLIKTGGFVQSNTVDDHINEEIVIVQRAVPLNRDDQRGYRNQESGDSEFPRSREHRRPGLRDLV